MDFFGVAPDTAKRRYFVMEVAIRAWSYSDDTGGERLKEGDIVVCRTVGTGIGLKEAHGYLWLRMEGLEHFQCGRLQDPFDDKPDGADDNDFPDLGWWDKRRFCIPLERLKIFCPALDLAKVRDRTLKYQPFLPIDEDDFRYTFSAEKRVLPMTGLVFDKRLQRYI